MSLIAYLWPLLIVSFAALLPGETLYIKHIIGAVVSFMGCWILLGGPESNFNTDYLFGYILAAACSIIWAVYSVASRALKKVPTDAVGLFCGVCATLGWVCYFLLETTFIATSSTIYLAVIALGLGPLGLAFFAWDIGLKQGNLPLLGVLSYATPLISTTMLIIFTDINASKTVYIACATIIVGALIASLNWMKLLYKLPYLTLKK